MHYWQRSFESCEALIARVNALGGRAEMLDPGRLGVRGNSHMIMQDRNNLQVADAILRWIGARVAPPPRPREGSRSRGAARDARARGP